MDYYDSDETIINITVTSISMIDECGNEIQLSKHFFSKFEIKFQCNIENNSSTVKIMRREVEYENSEDQQDYENKSFKEIDEEMSRNFILRDLQEENQSIKQINCNQEDQQNESIQKNEKQFILPPSNIQSDQQSQSEKQERTSENILKFEKIDIQNNQKTKEEISSMILENLSSISILQSQNDNFQDVSNCLFEEDITITVRRNASNLDIISIQNENNWYNNIILYLNSKNLSKYNLGKAVSFLRDKNINIEKFIGSGGEADVFLGSIYDFNGTKVEKAIRIICQDNKYHLNDEYNNVAMIKNPLNIVQYDCLLEVDNIQIYIMDKQICSLSDRMNDSYTNEQFWLLNLNIFESLIELRVNNLIHSDLKPSNFLLSTSGRYCLSDFGVSLKLNKGEEYTNEIKGYTVAFSSPEHLNGNPLSYSSDMYSSGIIALRLSFQLKEKQFQNDIEKFISQNLLQELPESRIKLFNLIPELIMKTSSRISVAAMKKYLKQLNEIHFLDPVNNECELLVRQKLQYSFKIVQIILVYMIKDKRDLISFTSIDDVSFDLFLDESVAHLFIDVAKLEGNCLSHQMKQKFLERGIFILESLNSFNSNENINIKKLLVEAEFLQGDFLLNKYEYQESIIHYQTALDLIKSNDASSEAKSEKINQDVAIFSSQIEDISLSQNKLSQISILIQIAKCHKERKEENYALKYCQEIVTLWITKYHFNQNQKSLIYLELVMQISISLFEVGEYTESYELSLKCLRLADDIKNEVLKAKIIELIANNLQKFSNIDLEYQLKEISNNQFYLIVQKIVLCEFGWYYYSNVNSRNDEQKQQLISILNSCDSIQAQIPFQSLVKLKIALIQSRTESLNLDQEKLFIKDLIDIYKNSNAVVSQNELELLLILIKSLKSLMQIDSAIECLLAAEEIFEMINFEIEDIKRSIKEEISATKEEAMLHKLLSQIHQLQLSEI